MHRKSRGLGPKTLGLLLCFTAEAAAAQSTAIDAPAETEETSDERKLNVILEEIVVTAMKHGDALVHDVPTAVTAFGSQQLEVLNFRDLSSLSYVMPNVQLESLGATKGIANFTIRGLGLNTSVPSIDPTVGVFVDGMYLGIIAGVLTENFDIEGVEVLRGPQGILFGRNVTGGAVVVRTNKPSEVLEGRGRLAYATGPNWTAEGAISGPLSERLSARVALFKNDDSGWFRNERDGKKLGQSSQFAIRPSLRWTPTDNLEFLLRYEHGKSHGDGPSGQNHALFSRDTFKVTSDDPGFYRMKWDQAILETNWDIPLGDGTITSIAAWRSYKSRSDSDIDATNNQSFALGMSTDQSQKSLELRYAGSFGMAKVTTGLYYFQQDLFYIEQRIVDANIDDAVPGIKRVGGGIGDFWTYGAFAALDIAVSDELTVNLGARYTHEEKKSDLSRVRQAADSLGGLPGPDIPGEGLIGGDIDAGTLNLSDPGLRQSWNDVSPRIGLQWKPQNDTQVYAFWAKGFRSGGLNIRHTGFGAPPVLFDAEEQDTYEIGWKQRLGRRGNLNTAVFQNKLSGMLRDNNIPDPVAGNIQVISNAGDATFRGVEVEGNYEIFDGLILSGQVGYTHGKYDKITVDLNGNGVVGDSADRNLKIPRLAPWTYGASIIYDVTMGELGGLSLNLRYNHRDRAFYTDNNRGVLQPVDNVDAGVTFRPRNAPWELAFFATNLTNDLTYGGDTVLADLPAFGGDGPTGPRPNPSYNPLNKGRVLGAELRVDF